MRSVGTRLLYLHEGACADAVVEEWTGPYDQKDGSRHRLWLAQGGAVSNVRGTVQNIQGNVSNYGGVVGNAYGQVSVHRLSHGFVTAFCRSAPWLRCDVVIMLQQSLLLAIIGVCQALTA